MPHYALKAFQMLKNNKVQAQLSLFSGPVVDKAGVKEVLTPGTDE